MSHLVILIYLRDDKLNTLEKRIAHMQQQGNFPAVHGRDGVIPLSENAILFDKSKAPDVYARVCSALHSSKNHPYMEVPISSASELLVVGTLPDELSASLEKLGVQLAKIL